jgi:hypothetical protein
MDSDIVISQLIKEHSFCSLEDIEVNKLTSVESVAQDKNSVNVMLSQNRKEDIIIKLLKVV